MKALRSIFRHYHYLLAFLFFGYVALLPLFLFGEYHYRHHDFLQRLGPLIALIKSGQFFEFHPHTQVHSLLDGMPRGFLPSPFFLKSLIFYGFGAKWGLVINNLLIRFLGFYGMHRLLSKHLLPGKENERLHWIIAAIFCSLPVFSYYGLSILGFPLLLCGLLDLYNKKAAWLTYLFIGIFCFYSYLYHTGFFAIALLILFQIYLLFRDKRVHKGLAFGTLLMIALYSFVEYMTIYNFFFPSEITTSHRSERVIEPALNWKGVLGMTLNRLLEGKYHAANYPGGIIYGLATLTLIANYFKDRWSIKQVRPLIIFLIFSVFLAFIPNLLEWKQLSFLYEKIHFLNMFDLRRFHFILSFTSILVLAYALKYWMDLFPRKRILLLLPASLLFLGLNIHLDRELREKPLRNEMTLNAFLSTDLMNRVKEETGNEKLIHIGMDPSVSQVNGIPTLDGYFNNYPLRYKKRFKEIIDPELQRSGHAEVFEEWGNKCYVFFDRDKIENGTLDIEINTRALSELGGRFVLSNYELKDPGSIGLKTVQEYRSDQSYWSPVHLYRVDPSASS